jgi:hypothetical protein
MIILIKIMIKYYLMNLKHFIYDIYICFIINLMKINIIIVNFD